MKALFWTLVVILGVLFSIQNGEKVTLRFGLHTFWNFEKEVSGVPLFLPILCSILLGVLIGGIGDFHRRFQLKKALRQNQKTLEKLEKEVQSLRASGSDQGSPKKQRDL
jgi:uncharacterized integral membrane protein